MGIVQRQMLSLLVNPQCFPIAQASEGFGIGRGLFLGNPPNVKNSFGVVKVQRDEEIEQLN